jgi:hypothetical protein
MNNLSQRWTFQSWSSVAGHRGFSRSFFIGTREECEDLALSADTDEVVTVEPLDQPRGCNSSRCRDCYPPKGG